MRYMRRLLWLSFLLLSLPLASFAQEARDVTRECGFVMPGGRDAREAITDRMYKTAWVSPKGRQASIRIVLPDGFDGGGLYLCWGNRPASWRLTQDDVEVASSDDAGYAHEYVDIKGGGTLRLVMQAEEKRKIVLGELFVFSGETPPGWVQRWQPTHEQADVMVLVAHPDDELLFMGGAIPYYELVRGKNVVVCYLTCANNMRQSEMLNGLWAMGIRHYPVIGRFPDQSLGTKARTYRLWGLDKARSYVTRLYRQYRPQVVISHDIHGEYGHAAHRVCAELAQYAFDAAASDRKHKGSLSRYGAWSVSKLYLHLGGENAVRMDWSQPFDALGGKTPGQLAAEGFAQHRSQQRNHRMDKNRFYDSTRFGLVKTRVGVDIQKNDFLENIPSSR